MQSDLLAASSATRGHFRYESGHHGNLWLHLDALFVNPRRVAGEHALRRLELIANGGNGGRDVVEDTGLWSMVLAQGSFETQDEKLRSLRWWFDGQVRFRDDTNGFNQGIVRPGLGYAITEDATAWLGYAWILTSPQLGEDFNEHRIWQQLTWSTQFEPVTFSTRTRLEQRFVETGDDVGWRFRQFFKLGYPLPFERRLSLVGYDEVFLNFNSTDWGAESGFDQNRFFAGLGWSFDERITLEVGYLNQFVHNESGDDTMNHILSINLLLSY